jgi:MEMO1 family protein
LHKPSERSIPSAMGTSKTSFGPTVAGSFYPSDPSTLGEMVHRFLDAGAGAAKRIDPDRRVVAIISPHAGYVYSGLVAGYAFGAVAGPAIRTVVVMGPSHHGHADQACVLNADSYRTPIGEVPVATDLVQTLIEQGKGLIEVRPEMFRPEHSVDVQIPLLKVALPNARIVPMIVPYMPESRFAALADLLFKLLSQDPASLLVASSDLSHFFAYATARSIDEEIMTSIEKSETDSLLAHHDQRAGPCGVAPIAVALDYLSRFGTAGRAIRLQYQNSGDTAGDRGRVVGYGAFALTAPRKAN